MTDLSDDPTPEELSEALQRLSVNGAAILFDSALNMVMEELEQQLAAVNLRREFGGELERYLRHQFEALEAILSHMWTSDSLQVVQRLYEAYDGLARWRLNLDRRELELEHAQLGIWREEVAIPTPGRTFVQFVRATAYFDYGAMGHGVASLHCSANLDASEPLYWPDDKHSHGDFVGESVPNLPHLAHLLTVALHRRLHGSYPLVSLRSTRPSQLQPDVEESDSEATALLLQAELHLTELESYLHDGVQEVIQAARKLILAVEMSGLGFRLGGGSSGEIRLSQSQGDAGETVFHVDKVAWSIDVSNFPDVRRRRLKRKGTWEVQFILNMDDAGGGQLVARRSRSRHAPSEWSVRYIAMPQLTNFVAGVLSEELAQSRVRTHTFDMPNSIRHELKAREVSIGTLVAPSDVAEIPPARDVPF